MKRRSTRTSRLPEIVLRNGKPAAVILDIQEYRELLERAEDLQDLKRLKAMRRGRMSFRPLEAVLADLKAGA